MDNFLKQQTYQMPEFDNDRERVLEHILQELAAEAGIMECDS